MGVIFAQGFGHINQFMDILHQVQWYVFFLVVAAQFWSYYSNARFYQSFLLLFDYHIDTKRLFKAALGINFVNQAFPSGGVSGASFLSGYLKGEVPVGKATLAQFVRYIFTYISFLGVLVVGFLLLLLAGNVSQITARVMLLVLLMVIIMSLLLVTVVADRYRMEGMARSVINFLNRLSQIIRRKRKRLITSEQITSFFDEFYEGYKFLLSERKKWRVPLLFALSGNVAELATIYVVFVAFGHWLNPGVVIAAYTLANLFSIISVISSGVGLYELTMVTALTALGVPFALSLSVVILYRVLNFAIFLPLGFYIYRQTLTQSSD
jgi:uncharacterized protein (TIRG00374 family)